MSVMTQKDRLLEAFRKSPDQTLSMGYINRELYMSQGNARLKELKAQGYTFKDRGKDEHGFKLHQLTSEPTEVVEASKPKLTFGSKADLFKLKYSKF